MMKRIFCPSGGRRLARFDMLLNAASSKECRAMSDSSSNKKYDFKTMTVSSLSEYVKHVELSRPEKRNSMNTDFWRDMPECFQQLAVDQDCRAIIISGAGPTFSAGLDFQDNEAFGIITQDIDIARKVFQIKKYLKFMQTAFTSIEKCPKPVIAAIHNACPGAGVTLVSACDIRYCTQDAWFNIKEVDLGLAADLGTLSLFQRITKSDSITRELTYTGRKFFADEAKEIGFVGRVFTSKEEMMKAAQELAETIAKKSPVAVQSSKVNLIYARDHPVPQSLDYVTTWNAAMLQSEDVMKAMSAMMQKQIPTFSKL